MTLAPELLQILVCPKCKGELEYKEEQNELICSACRLRYEVRDGIPIMLPSEARPLAIEDKKPRPRGLSR